MGAKALSRALDFISDLIYPNWCPFCQEVIPWDAFCCKSCRDKLETAEFCKTCGMSVCDCKTASHSYDGCAVAAPYVGKVREGVLAFKYHCGFNFAKLYAPKLCSLIREYGFIGEDTVVTAVPMSYSRKNTTGYNQAEYLAKLISKNLGLPHSFGLIKKRGGTVQHELGADERAEAAKRSYVQKRGVVLSGKTVILCDDIITTGSTLSVCSEVLKNSGAERVYCAVLCGTVSAKKEENK